MSNTVQGASFQGYAGLASGAASSTAGGPGRSGQAWEDVVRKAQGRPGAPEPPPTSLLTERLGDGSASCLEAATRAAGPSDDLVFLQDDRTGAGGDAIGAGHVVIRDRATGEVRDPSEPGSKVHADLDAWMAGHAAEDGGPAYSLDGAVASDQVRDVLSRSPEERQARIAALGNSTLSTLAGNLYADAPAAGEAELLRTLTANWDALRQGDDTFSRADLEEIAGDTPPEWANDALKDVAHKLLDNGGFLDRLDTTDGSRTDGKVDDEDIGAVMQSVPPTEQDSDALNVVARNWDALRQGDDTFSRDDLEKIAGDTPPEWANDELKDAARKLLDRPDLLTFRLDVAGEGGVPDGKVDDEDLGAAMQSAPLSPAGEKAVRTLDANWDAMRQGQDTISASDLTIMTSDTPPDFVTPEIRSAAQYLLAHPETLKFQLDLAGKGSKSDGDLARADVDAMMSRLPSTPTELEPEAVKAGAPAPAFMDYTKWGAGPDDGTIEYETSEGKFIVSQKEAPELYERIKSDTAAHDSIKKAVEDGADYALPGVNPSGDGGKPEDLGNGVFKFEADGKKYVVARATNPVLYGKVAEAAEAAKSSDVNDIRAKHDLPPSGELNVPALKTDVPSDPKKADSERLTVSGLATSNLIEDYRKGIKDGSIGKDDPRAKLVRALEAKSAVENGRGITGYTDGSWRSADSEQTQLTSADMQDIVGGDKVDDSLQTLFQDETVSKDFEAKMKEALGHIPDKEALTQKLEETLLGKDGDDTRYIDYIKELKDSGKSDAAQADVSAMVQSLTLLDPEKGKAAVQELSLVGVTADLNELVGDPSKVSDENKLLASKDLFDLLKGLFKSGASGLPQHTVSTIEKFIEGFLNGKVDQKKAIETIQDAAKEAEANGGKIPAASLDKYAAFMPIKDREGFLGFIGGMNDKGMLGSLGGGISLMSGIYQLTAKNGQFADTPLERLSIAKEFLSFVGASGHFIKTGDAIFEALGKGGAVDLLGLSKEVPEIWGSQGLWGKKLEQVGAEGIEGHKLPPQPSVGSDFGREMGEEIDRIFSEHNAAHPRDPASPVAGANGDDVLTGTNEALNTQLDKSGVPKVDPSTTAKIAGSAVKVLAATTDGVTGVADIVLGAFTIKDGVKTGNEFTQAAGGLQVVGGATGAVAGGIGIAALFGPVAAGVSAAAGPLFLVGAAIGGIGAVVGYFSQHKKEQQATDKEGDWYEDLAKDGLLKGDWADKVEYARYSFSTYGNRDAPNDKSIFRYQEDEWNHFRSTPQENGGSSNRLDKSQHLDYLGDGQNNLIGDREAR